jgi:uncharacterized lipoprotein YddW (UPF0748 family)
MAIMLTGIFLSFVMSSINTSLTIPSSGIITPVLASGSVSQVRAVFIHSYIISSVTSWDLIASTLASYGINLVAIEEGGVNYLRYPSSVSPNWADYNCSSAAIAAFHQYGIQVYYDFDVMMGGEDYGDLNQTITGGRYTGDAYWNGSQVVNETVGASCGLDPTNPYSIACLDAIFQEAVTQYNFDGVMYDYIYYDWENEPLTTYAQTMFTSMTGLGAGLTYSQWVADVVPASDGGNGQWNTQFMDWRVQVLNNLVANLTTTIHQARSNVTIAATAFNFADGVDTPYYWRYVQGMDPVYWAYDGSVNMICPMMYSASGDNYSSDVPFWQQYGTGGAHGDVPLVPIVWSCNPGVTTVTVADFTVSATSILNAGADGIWIMTYGGPGCTADTPDIRPYLSSLGWPNPPTFTLNTISLNTLNSTSVSVSWSTTLPSTSLVEYSTNPLFSASPTGTSPNDYYVITHNTGTIVASSQNVTNHNIILSGLLATTYYFRVQSEDPSGTATSNVLTFSTS